MMPRRALAADCATVKAVIDAAFAPYAPLIGRNPAPMQADCAALIAAGAVWLCTDQAVMACAPCADSMELDILAVSPAAQGQGLGARLVAQCESLARQMGLPAVTLHTNAAMTGALRLYPKLGYTETDRRVDQGFQRVFFRKTL